MSPGVSAALAIIVIIAIALAVALVVVVVVLFVRRSRKKGIIANYNNNYLPVAKFISN